MDNPEEVVCREYYLGSFGAVRISFVAISEAGKPDAPRPASLKEQPRELTARRGVPGVHQEVRIVIVGPDGRLCLCGPVS